MNPMRFLTLSAIAALFAMLAIGCSKPGTKINTAVDYYTCAMHTFVHSKDPGKCPICGMELIPVMKKDAQAKAIAPRASGMTEFTVPVERQQRIGVTYATVKTRTLSRTIRAVGFIVPDEKRNWSYVPRVNGYVQQLFVTSPGEIVEKDAPLLSLYSPDLLTSERELMALLADRNANDATGRLVEAAKLRLRQWNVTDEQIAELEKSRQPNETLTLRSPFRGVVVKVSVSQGAAVKIGDTLVNMADLSEVWVWVDFYETEIALLRQGQKVIVTSIAYPGRIFDGTVALVDPFVDPVKRTTRARIDVKNLEFLLRPGMYVNADLHLDPITALAIPVNAVMPTGVRNLAFVDKGNGKLAPRFVILGEKFDDYFSVQKGLSAGERVVTSANFLIDAESKMQGALKDFGDDNEEAGPSAGEKNAALRMNTGIVPVVETYLALHDLLANDRFDGVTALGDKLRQQVAGLVGSNVPAFRQAVDDFKPANLKEARIGFGRVSAALLGVLKEIPIPRILYVMRCPMWDSSSSEWVQVSKQVQNPFLGRAMATCGETIRTLGQ